MKPELMKFDPATGDEFLWPCSVETYREKNPTFAWLFNPYTGLLRNAQDVASDVFGFALVGDGPLVAAPKRGLLSAEEIQALMQTGEKDENQ